MNTKHGTAAIYTRISSDPSGERAGVQRQRTECEALAAANGLTVVATFEDNDRSAFSGKPRPEFERLLADAAAGRFSTVIVWAVDRLYRRLADLERIVTELEGAGVNVLAVKSGDIDLSTADGRLHARLLGSVAQHESEKKSERITARARQRATGERRTVASNLPFGWRWVDPDPTDPTRPRPGSKSGLEPDPVTGPALAGAYRDVAGGLSVYAAHKRLAERVDIGKMTSSTLAVALRLPRHAGLASYRGEVTGEAADGQRIVERDLWDQVQAILADPSRRTSPGRPANTLLGGGLLRCGKCGGPMAASNRDRVPVYVCSRKQCMSRRRAILDQLATERVGEVLAALAEQDLLTAPDQDDDPSAPIRAHIADLEAKVAGLDAALAAGQLDVVDYTRAVSKLREVITGEAEKLVKIARRPALARLADQADTTAAWQTLAAEDTLAARAVLAELLDTITATADRALRYQWAGWLAPHDPEVLTTVESLPAHPIPPRRHAIEQNLGRPLPEVIGELRARGLSWRKVADQISELSGVRVTHSGVQKWAGTAA